MRRRSGEYPQPPRLDVRHERRHVGEEELHLSRDEIRQRGAGAFVRHVKEIDLREVLQVFATEVQ